MPRTPRDPEGRMPLREHLVEVRKRVVRIALGLLLGAILGWIVYDPLLDALVEPLARASAERGALIGLNFDGVATAIDIHFKVALFLGVIVSSPWWLYQVFAFVNPGLTRAERKYVYGFLAAAVPMFLAGVVMAWLVLPSVVLVLNSFVPEGNANLIGAQLYLSFVMRLVLACGIAFLVPVFMVVLNLMGVVTGRTWLAGWRWAILVSFVFAAMVTPTLDVMTMFGLAAPICVLYFAATGLCLLHDRRAARRRVAPVE
ncbi:Sec-independent protein translocase TatC [Isoptericola jiangsuensis]|uniref:Sec-independent protein translocase protein TatC n=1 Tax=Isoptericola jiangsuensis TaxID=548579 RepID=A0A2A9EYA2_9MICO|nr:twin-arginine translocase subunit TatC [Isoptericola jiangsuensis]PFG43195.1 Sec-independent protein translocase TatC [Isoptericola jiangsuensis]